MSDSLKGGFTPFATSGAFKQNTTTSLFGNTPTANTGSTGTQGAPATTSNAFGGASGGLFGNFGAKPASGGLFGGGSGTTSNSTPSAPAPFSGFGNAATNTAQPFSSNSATSSTPIPTLGSFGVKPPEQNASGTTPGTSTTGTTPTPAFGFMGTNPTSTATTSTAQPSSSAPAPPSFFSLPPKSADGASSGNTPAAGGLFGTQKNTDSPTVSSTPASTTPAAPSIFSAQLGKKDDEASKDKATPAGPSGMLFGQPPASGTSTSNTLPGFGGFGQKPAEKKDGSEAAPTKEGEKKDGTAPLFGAPTGASTVTGAGGAGSSSAPATSISVPPPSMLRGKTIEEIVNKWSSDLETQVKEFSRLATEIAVWDRALIANGNTIKALFDNVLLAEREQNDIEQSLKHVEDQQKELSATLEVYEKAAGELFDGQGGGLRALDVGPADAERDKHYTLAADLNSNLDDLSRSLMQMIDSVNTLSEGSMEGSDSSTKADAPLEVIAQILSSHLESLQWIDTAVREVDTKVTDVEKRIREASAGNNAANSVSGTVNSHAQRSRGFGVR